MRPRAGLKLGEQVAHVRLHRLLAEEEALADLTVDEALGDQLQHLDLAVRRLLLELLKRSLEGNHLTAARAGPTSSSRLEAALVIDVAGENLPALGSIHETDIGRPPPDL